VFDSIGWGEIVVLALAALFIFGPERLPDLAKDAAAGIKKIREAVTGIRAQVDETMGDDLAQFRDIDLRKYHPKTFIRDQLWGADEDADVPPLRTGTAVGSAGLLEKPPTTVTGPPQRSRDQGTPPPFDVDAT
jgi:sec-independent protein translocase protein TatB